MKKGETKTMVYFLTQFSFKKLLVTPATSPCITLGQQQNVESNDIFSIGKIVQYFKMWPNYIKVLKIPPIIPILAVTNYS